MTPEKIHAWRTSLGHSLTEAAQALGVSRRYYCYLESGGRKITRPVELACERLTEIAKQDRKRKRK